MGRKVISLKCQPTETEEHGKLPNRLKAAPLVYQVSTVPKRKLGTEALFSHLTIFSSFLPCVVYLNVKLPRTQMVIAGIPSL